MTQLTDPEIAVIIDCLAFAQKAAHTGSLAGEHPALVEAGSPTPNINSALQKIMALTHPKVSGMEIHRPDRPFSGFTDSELEVIASGLSADRDSWLTEARAEADRLCAEANAEVDRRPGLRAVYEGDA